MTHRRFKPSYEGPISEADLMQGYSRQPCPSLSSPPLVLPQSFSPLVLPESWLASTTESTVTMKPIDAPKDSPPRLCSCGKADCYMLN